MKIVLDSDVAKVAEFMLRNVPASDLQRVAHGLSELADLVWKASDIEPSQKRRIFKIERDGNVIRNSDVVQQQPATTLRD